MTGLETSIMSMLGRGGDTWVTEATVISDDHCGDGFSFFEGGTSESYFGRMNGLSSGGLGACVRKSGVAGLEASL